MGETGPMKMDQALGNRLDKLRDLRNRIVGRRRSKRPPAQLLENQGDSAFGFLENV
jgi:hypothetical protein